MRAAAPEVAIIGMACLFPGAPDLKTFWENILAGTDAIGEPPVRWGADRVRDSDAGGNDRLYTTRGGYLGETVRFDPTKFGVMPRSIDGGEPEQFVALQLAHDALADAGYLDRPFDRTRAGVILGRGTYVNRGLVACFQHTIVVDQVIDLLRRLHPEHDARELAELKRSLKDNLPPFNPETAPGLAHSVMCGRIANRLDLMGPAFTVDAACSSSLIAVDYGIRDLADGVCDLVLAGGVQISTTHPIAMLFAQLGALSRSGRIRPFHPEADGLLLGEGAGIVALKRRADAERDGDRIYAVIRGVGTSSDGRAMGILAPRVEGEELAMRRAYEAAGIDPADIGLLEAHGTGTPVGDATEIEAMRRIFGGGDGGGPVRPRCAVGSIKSMIGHCIPAAAAAGLIKTALALYHRTLPPTLHAPAPHPAFVNGPLYINSQTRPWIHAGPGPRRAAVSAFGFGGINAHAILEEHGAPLSGRAGASPSVNLHARRDSELFLIQAPDRPRLLESLHTLRAFIAANPGAAPSDLAFSLNVPEAAPGGAARLAIVAGGFDDLDRKLEYAAARLQDPSRRRIKEIGGVYYFEEPLARTGSIAFLFPGEGAQYPGMLADLCLHFPETRAWFDLMDRAFHDHPRGFRPSEVLYPVPGDTAAQDRLWEMDSAIESVFAANQALHTLLTRLGIRPAAVAGHSTGEYSALLASGAAVVEDDDAMIAHVREGNDATERARHSGIVPPGVLLAVGPADLGRLRDLVAASGGALHLAMDNCPHQAVVCGDEQAIAEAQTALRGDGAVCQRLPFERAYHTPRFEPVLEELRPFYDRASFRAPQVPLYSCATAARVPDDPAAIRRLALLQWARPVRFRETIEAMYADGARLFVEVGPRGNLTAFVEDTLRGRPHLAVASNVRARSGVTQLHHLLGLLAAHGVDLDLAPLYENRGARRLDAAALRSGDAIKARAERGTALSLELPTLQVDDALVARMTRRPLSVVPAALPRVPRPDPTPDVDARPQAVYAVAAATSRTSAPARHAGPTAVAASPERDRVMRAYLGTMDRFLAAQRGLMESLMESMPQTSAPRPAAVPPVAGASAPLLTGAIATHHDGALRLQRTLALDEEIVLRSHTLGGRIAADESLRALPICPLALSLEMIAEAAASCRPGSVVTGMSGVRVHRWLAFTHPSVTIRLTARPRDGADAGVIDVLLEEMPADGTTGPAAVVVEAAVHLGRRPAVPPAAGPDFSLSAPRAPRWSPAELYAEGMTHGMFHGEPLRGVVALRRMGDDGIEGDLRGLPTDRLLRSNPAPRFALDPILLDAAGQLLGFWTADALESGFVVFPVEVDRLEFFADPLPAGGSATGRVRVTSVDATHVSANIEVAGVDGRLLLRAAGWRDRRFRMPERFYEFRLDPLGRMASVAWEAPAGGRAGTVCRRIDLASGEAQGPDADLWRTGLAWLALGPQEREEFLALRTPPGRRTAWLLGRVAVKDAARALLRDLYGLSLYPADIRITAAEGGRLFLAGAWTDRVPRIPLISLSHTDGLAVAIAADPGEDGSAARGAGIDVERVRSLDPSFEEVAFGDRERELLGRLHGGRRDEWVIRLWCAKEAAAKALGLGLAGGPRSLMIETIDEGNGMVRVRPAEGASPPGIASVVPVFTGREGDVVHATAIDDARRT